MSICIFGECMVVCIVDLVCMFVGFDEGNCFCFVYDIFFIFDLIEFIYILGWKYFDI